MSSFISEPEYFIPAQHYFFIISGIISMLSIIQVGEKNILYYSDSIKTWRQIMQYNPSTLVSLCSKHKLYNHLKICFESYAMYHWRSRAPLLKKIRLTALYLMNGRIPSGFHWLALDDLIYSHSKSIGLIGFQVFQHVLNSWYAFL